MHRLTRVVALLALAILPTGCDWCQAPGSWAIVATGMVHDSTGADLGEARLSLSGLGQAWRATEGTLQVELIGPAALAGTPPRWPAGGPLQG